MITPRDIERKSMTEEKRNEAKNSTLGFYIGRPISYVLTIPFLYTNISPNTVTVFSILFVIIGFGVLSFAQSVGMRLVGQAFIVAWAFADGIDGNIARYKDIKSENGDMLDTLGGYLAAALIVLAMGNTAYWDHEGLVIVSPMVPVIIGGFSAVSTIIPRLMMHRKMHRDLEKSNGKPVEGLKKKLGNVGGSSRLPRIVFNNLCDPAGGQLLWIFIAIVCHLCTEFTLFYCAINVFIMIYSIISMLEKPTKKNDQA